jgi:hypothetical protein
MASTINASSTGSGGLITTGDASGELALQANGVTQATVSSTGLAMATGQTISTANTYGFKNRLLNGYFNVWQRGTTVTSVGIDTFGTDRWRQWANSGTQTGISTWSQSTDVPTGQEFEYSCKIAVTTAQASFSASQGYAFQQRIEANNVYDFAYGTSGAKSVTLSFWAKTTKTGTYTVALTNDGTSSSNVYKQAVSLTSSWAKYQITIPGDTSLAINTTGTSQGSSVSIMLSNGTTSAVTNTWQAYSLGNTTATGQVNFFDSTSNELYITGFQLEVGSQATSFDFRSIGTELLLCYRYYFGGFQSQGGTCYSATVLPLYAQFPVSMRAAPTVSFKTGTSSVVVDIYGGGGGASTIDFTDHLTVNGGRVSLLRPSGGVLGIPFDLTSDSLQASAEL